MGLHEQTGVTPEVLEVFQPVQDVVEPSLIERNRGTLSVLAAGVMALGILSPQTAQAEQVEQSGQIRSFTEYFDWSGGPREGSGANKYTRRFPVNEGELCVRAAMKLKGAEYNVELNRITNGRARVVYDSPDYAADGNPKDRCWYNIKPGVYTVKIDPDDTTVGRRGPVMRGSVKVVYR